MEGTEGIRLEALRVLTNLAVNDDQFRHGLWTDLEGTLTRYGFALNDREIAQVRSIIYAFDDSIEEDVFGGQVRQHR